MPRTRQIKYEFFVDDDLAQQSPHGRLLFIGLWTLADRDGKLEDKPMKIKAQLFPYEQVDVEHLLTELSCGFIERYEANGKKYIKINKFSKHQHPHKNEPNSELPDQKPSDSGKIGSTPSKTRVTRSKNRATREKSGAHGLDTSNLILETRNLKLEPSNLKLETRTLKPDIGPVAPPPANIAREFTPIQRVVRAYKVLKLGKERRDDPVWDKANFPRYAKAAKSILEAFGGDLEKSVAYVIMRGNKLIAAGCDWTLETVARHAHDDGGIFDGREQEAVGSNTVLDDRSAQRIASGGGRIFSAGEILANGPIARLGQDDRRLEAEPILDEPEDEP